METVELAGRNALVKSGRIASYGNFVTGTNRTKYSIIEFDDGERLREVWADSAVDRYMAVGTSGDFVFLKLNGTEHCLVAFEAPDLGLRVADRQLWADIAGLVYLRAIGFVVMGLLLAFFLIGIPIAALGIYLLTIGAKLKNIGVYADTLRDMGRLRLSSTPPVQILDAIPA